MQFVGSRLGRADLRAMRRSPSEVGTHPTCVQCVGPVFRVALRDWETPACVQCVGPVGRVALRDQDTRVGPVCRVSLRDWDTRTCSQCAAPRLGRADLHAMRRSPSEIGTHPTCLQRVGPVRRVALRDWDTPACVQCVGPVGRVAFRIGTYVLALCAEFPSEIGTRACVQCVAPRLGLACNA
jgi:hypothetical protein